MYPSSFIADALRIAGAIYNGTEAKGSLFLTLSPRFSLGPCHEFFFSKHFLNPPYFLIKKT
jgi:hypothetical protein